MLSEEKCVDFFAKVNDVIKKYNKTSVKKIEVIDGNIKLEFKKRKFLDVSLQSLKS